MKTPENTQDYTAADLKAAGERFGLDTSNLSTLLRTVGDNARDVLESPESSKMEAPQVQGTATSWEL